MFLWRLPYVFLFLLTGLTPVAAQLDHTHFIPPMHARYERGQHYLYLTTPETIPFEVTLTDGTGQPVPDANGNPIGPILLSNATPQALNLGNGETPADMLVTLTRPNQLNQPLNGKGLILRAEKPFYANLRVRSYDQAGSLTAKGRNAAGLRFRAGHVVNVAVPQPNWNRRSNFIGIMATRDGTEVTLTGFEPGMTLNSGSGDQPAPDTVRISLLAGQCYVLCTYVDAARPPANGNGLQGLLIEATEPVVVNTGSWLGSPTTIGLQDIGFDQIVPEDRVGTEYITIRGDGPDDLETPVVIATQDSTDIFLQGLPAPAVTLHAGEYFQVPPGSYSANENLYIRATRPVYVFQMMGGAPYMQTGGLNFVPPLGCSEGGSVNQIMDIDRIGNTVYEGKLILLAEAGKTVWINQTPVSAGLFQSVPGKPEFVTLKLSGQTGHVRVDSDGPLQVGMYGRNNNAGWAGYFSGFDTFHRPTISISLSSSCGDTLFLQDLVNADSVIWHHNGTPVQLKSDSILPHVQPGTYFAVALREFCGESLWDTSDIILIPEPFEALYTATPVTCPGSWTGTLAIHNVKGGFPPYEVSFNGGQSYGTQFHLDSLAPGIYTALFRDSMGCIFEMDLEVPFNPDIPLVVIDPPDTLTCARDSVLLVPGNGSSSGPGYIGQWLLPDGSEVHSPTLAVRQPGSYLYRITKLANACTSADSVVVLQDTIAPVVALPDPPPLTCRDTAIGLEGMVQSAHGVALAWALNGQALPNGPDTTALHAALPGIYTLLATDTRNGCTAEATVHLVEDKAPPHALPPPPAVLTCRDSVVALTLSMVSPVDAQIRWTTPDGWEWPGNPGPMIWVRDPGLYQVVLTDPANGCTLTLEVNVETDTIPPLPDAGTASSLNCRDTIIPLTGSVDQCPACVILWTHVDSGIVAGGHTLTPSIRLPGTYLMTALNAGNGCQASDSLVVHLISPPDSAGFDLVWPTCEDRFGALYITGVTGGTPPYDYSFDGGLSFGAASHLDPAPAGTHVMVVRDAYGCLLTQQADMYEIQAPDLEVEPVIQLEWGQSVVLGYETRVPEPLIAEVVWSPEEALSCTRCPHPVASPLTTTEYRVVLTDIYGCSVAADIRVVVDLDAAVYAPNAIHPDADGVNDGFTLYGDPDKVIRINRLLVYDRWGNAVFETRDIPVNRPDLGWEGTYRGRVMDPAVFVWWAEVLLVNGERITRKGEVHILR